MFTPGSMAKTLLLAVLPLVLLTPLAMADPQASPTADGQPAAGQPGDAPGQPGQPDVAAWVNQLRFAGNEDRRVKAVEQLAALADHRTLPILHQAAVYDGSADVRDAARKAVLKITNNVSPKDHVPLGAGRIGLLMGQLLNAKDAGERAKSAKELAKAGDPAAVSALEIAAVFDAREDIREMARNAAVQIRKSLPADPATPAAPTAPGAEDAAPKSQDQCTPESDQPATAPRPMAPPALAPVPGAIAPPAPQGETPGTPGQPQKEGSPEPQAQAALPAPSPAASVAPTAPAAQPPAAAHNTYNYVYHYTTNNYATPGPSTAIAPPSQVPPAYSQQADASTMPGGNPGASAGAYSDQPSTSGPTNYPGPTYYPAPPVFPGPTPVLIAPARVMAPPIVVIRRPVVVYPPPVIYPPYYAPPAGVVVGGWRGGFGVGVSIGGFSFGYRHSRWYR